jgi:hypothetical protein
MRVKNGVGRTDTLTARPFITRISQVEDCAEDSRGYC